MVVVVSVVVVDVPPSVVTDTLDDVVGFADVTPSVVLDPLASVVLFVVSSVDIVVIVRSVIFSSVVVMVPSVAMVSLVVLVLSWVSLALIVTSEAVVVDNLVTSFFVVALVVVSSKIKYNCYLYC